MWIQNSQEGPLLRVPLPYRLFPIHVSKNVVCPSQSLLECKQERSSDCDVYPKFLHVREIYFINTKFAISSECFR